MKKMIISTALIVTCSLPLLAADLSSGNVKKSPLTTYSGGIGVGGMASMNNELKDLSENFLKVSFLNTVYFQEFMSFFFDANWYAPGTNFGLDAGMDFVFSSSTIKPFAGFGVGALYINKDDDFGKNISPAATIHLGCAFDLNESVQLRFRVPFHYAMNNDRDQMVGLEVGLLFSDKFKKVKKLNYN
jgi:hypothetical protein